MLEAKDLTKSYSGIPAVNGVSFSIRPGEILGYLGPNGSGKSTTVKMLTGLMEPTTGHILFRGKDIRDNLTEYKCRLGYVPEEPHLYPYLSGKEYLELAGSLRGIPRTLLHKKIAALLELFSISGSRFSPLQSYSKGMRQKVLIIAALLHDPDILIFDEPLSGLDITAAGIFRNMVREMAREGKTILYCSHVLEVVEKICTHVLILDRGNCVAHETVDRLRESTALQTLEQSFSHLVNEPDKELAAREMVGVMRWS
ncbi:MAG TPA: ABC transporter ATP-binding protein [Bryobacteraceae bacterium]|jgi:ABC-2 type transport system ATP-binding protein|nr:ABC transporter ATP-binding protein [Bryobacteraceae bacterium]